VLIAPSRQPTKEYHFPILFIGSVKFLQRERIIEISYLMNCQTNDLNEFCHDYRTIVNWNGGNDLYFVFVYIFYFCDLDCHTIVQDQILVGCFVANYWTNFNHFSIHYDRRRVHRYPLHDHRTTLREIIFV
jgi:hypothetical protein